MKTDYPDSEFEIDVAQRRATHTPSRIAFTFHTYATEEEWASAGPANLRDNPAWKGDRAALATAAKRAAVAAGMKAKR
jgi:hypothetical protein